MNSKSNIFSCVIELYKNVHNLDSISLMDGCVVFLYPYKNIQYSDINIPIFSRMIDFIDADQVIIMTHMRLKSRKVDLEDTELPLFSTGGSEPIAHIQLQKRYSTNSIYYQSDAYKFDLNDPNSIEQLITFDEKEYSGHAVEINTVTQNNRSLISGMQFIF